MRRDVRNALRAGAGAGAGRTLPLAVLLTVLVIAAAGIGGTAHFAGPRWYPHLGGGTPAPVHAVHRTVPTGATLPPGRPRHPKVGLPGWLLILLIAAAVVVVVLILWRWWAGRRAPVLRGAGSARVQSARMVVDEPEPEPEVLLTGIELALQALDEQRDPADAVVRAWLGLQETAEGSGIVRHPSETPTEFTSRIMQRAFADDRALGTLLRLYLRTRFGNHPVTADDVAAVRDALRQLVADWHGINGSMTTTVR